MKYWTGAWATFITAIIAGCGLSAIPASGELVRDAEYYILEAQNTEAWAQDDKAVDAKLKDFRARNGGKPPNILYILVDDIMDEMDKLGVADNTLLVLMGDNGHFTKYSPGSGYTPMIYKGGKGYSTEGGVHVGQRPRRRTPGWTQRQGLLVLHQHRGFCHQPLLLLL